MVGQFETERREDLAVGRRSGRRAIPGGFSFSPEHAIPAGPLSMVDLDMEQALQRGSSHDDDERGVTQITVRRYPYLLLPVYHALKRNRQLTKSAGLRQRLVLAHGMAIMGALPTIQTLSDILHDIAKTDGPDLDTMVYKFREATYMYRTPKLATARTLRQDHSITKETREMLASLRETLRLSQSFIVNLSVMFSVATSTEWIPRSIHALCVVETEHFKEYLDTTIQEIAGG